MVTMCHSHANNTTYKVCWYVHANVTSHLAMFCLVSQISVQHDPREIGMDCVQVKSASSECYGSLQVKIKVLKLFIVFQNQPFDFYATVHASVA